MKGFSVLALLCLLNSSVLAAQERPRVYFGAGYTFMRYTEDVAPDIDVSADLGGVSLLVGVPLGDVVSVEVRYIAGVDDDRVRLLGESFDFEVDYVMGVNLRAAFPATEYLTPYFILGKTSAELKLSGQGFKFSDDISDISYGMGLNISWPNSRAMFNLEYAQLIDDDGVELGGLNLGVQLPIN